MNTSFPCWFPGLRVFHGHRNPAFILAFVPLNFIFSLNCHKRQRLKILTTFRNFTKDIIGFLVFKSKFIRFIYTWA